MLNKNTENNSIQTLRNTSSNERWLNVFILNRANQTSTPEQLRSYWSAEIPQKTINNNSLFFVMSNTLQIKNVNFNYISY